MTRMKTLSSATGMIAALSMAITPAYAAELPEMAPHSSAPVSHNWEQGDETAERHRRYRYRRHRGIDAGDVLTGVLIIGGIAAIASAASDRSDRRRAERTRYRESNPRASVDRSIDRAINGCLSRIERDVRVEAVNTVNRTADGWDVAGTLYNGEGFSCRMDDRGRVDGISYGARTAQADYGQMQDRQYSSDRYAAAWARHDARTAQIDFEPIGPQPAYPGGPLPGEEIYDEQMGG